jgi:hypothetical protein
MSQFTPYFRPLLCLNLLYHYITRANHRHETTLSIGAVSEKALNLPTLLILSEIALYGQLTETSIVDIVDNILLPIYKVEKEADTERESK